ncbi:MAG: tyrosine-protein phosphatase [Isosphaeraceae bacterium]
MNQRLTTRWLAKVVLAVPLLSFLAFWGWRHAVDNIGTVIAADSPQGPASAVFRSDQMSPKALSRFIADHHIQTVLNLRGPNPGESWYDAERSTTLVSGAVQVDMPLSSCEWMSRDQALKLAETIRSARRPMLIHCFHGSERTGLASAMTRLLTEGQTLADARQAFSWKYLFFGLGDGVVTLRQFEAYTQWLEAKGLKHTPEQFLAWLRTDFKPGSPSREAWPYDPYPLVITSHPPLKSAELTPEPAMASQPPTTQATLK